MLLFVDNLTNCDFSYLHPSRGLVGETWLAGIELEGALDEQGMVCDFGVVKAAARRLLDDWIDHRLLVPRAAPNLSLQELADSIALQWTLPDGEILFHRSPRQCVTLIDADAITPEAAGHWCAERLRRDFPGSVERIAVTFTPETIHGDYYHYSHGLKKHAGKCQRIAHGHRSRIEIWRDGERAPELERLWAEILRDSYIGTSDDQAAEPAPTGYRHFHYRAHEGEFDLQLPERCCHLIEADSTVENIATHIARQLKAGDPGREFRVKAYEGLAKGAIART